MLRVYEIKGSGRPRDVPAEGLEGVWPEPPFYYLFYRKETWKAGPPAVAGCSFPTGSQRPAPRSASTGVAREGDEPVAAWLKSHSGWRLTSRYDLPYEKWQDISAARITLGSFNVRTRLFAAQNKDRSPADRVPGTSILIDPGVVFGSGLHPTTQGCLLAISEIFGSNKIYTAVDFGAGTGILAIACALAEARFVLAIDRNPLALKIARANARANGVEGRIAFVETDGPGCLGISPDLFIMNLEWPVLEKILAAGEWRNSRRVVLAGFLEGRLETVKRFAGRRFQVDNVIELEGWPTVSLKSVNSEQTSEVPRRP